MSPAEFAMFGVDVDDVDGVDGVESDLGFELVDLPSFFFLKYSIAGV